LKNEVYSQDLTTTTARLWAYSTAGTEDFESLYFSAFR
jgi:hypothetical protein